MRIYYFTLVKSFDLSDIINSAAFNSSHLSLSVQFRCFYIFSGLDHLIIFPQKLIRQSFEKGELDWLSRHKSIESLWVNSKTKLTQILELENMN